MKNLIILIPPSEGKAPLGSHPPLSQLSPLVGGIYKRLLAYQGSGQELYGVKGKALAAAVQANQNLLLAPTLPAIERYAGVVYDGIDYASLPASAKDFFNRHVRIVSALFGLVAPQDLLPDYKLKIEKLDAAKYWEPVIAKQLREHWVLDLLPQAHQKAVSYDQGCKVDFIILKRGQAVPAGHQGKLIKGKFVRWLCLHQIVSPADWRNFKEDGYCYDGKNFIKMVSTP